MYSLEAYTLDFEFYRTAKQDDNSPKEILYFVWRSITNTPVLEQTSGRLVTLPKEGITLLRTLMQAVQLDWEETGFSLYVFPGLDALVIPDIGEGLLTTGNMSFLKFLSERYLDFIANKKYAVGLFHTHPHQNIAVPSPSDFESVEKFEKSSAGVMGVVVARATIAVYNSKEVIKQFQNPYAKVLA